MAAFPLLQNYFDAEQKVFDYFGYVEDWRRLPMVDSTAMYWRLDDTEQQAVRFAESEAQLEDDSAGDFYVDEIYTQRHLPKWVYRGADFTMVCVDTHTDGNQFLRIFDNSKERKVK